MYIPTWYIDGVICAFILTSLKLAWFWYMGSYFPKFKDFLGTILLVIFDSLFSWIAVAIGLVQLWTKRKERREMILELQKLNKWDL